MRARPSGRVQAPTQAASTPPPAKMKQPAPKPAPSELEQREARLWAQMEAKKAKRQARKGRGRSKTWVIAQYRPQAWVIAQARFIPACGPAHWLKRSVGRIWPSRTPRRRRPQAWGDQVTCQWPADQVTALHPGQRCGPACRRSTATRSGAGGDLSVAQTPYLGQASWSSARRGYGRRWKPRRRNARLGRGAADNCAAACKIIKCKRSHHE